MSDENEKTTDDSEIKVTDKRMFTSDGELREEYRGRVDESGGAQAASSPPSPGAPGPGRGPSSPGIVGPEAGMPSKTTTGSPESAASAAGAPAAARSGATPAQATPKASMPQTPKPGSAALSPPGEESPAGEEGADGESEYPSGAQFEDLIGLLAQGASVYLQQARRPERRSEHLELARLHVDLLAILKKKTEGNLSAGEKALLDDALYQLRMAVVQHG